MRVKSEAFLMSMGNGRHSESLQRPAIELAHVANRGVKAASDRTDSEFELVSIRERENKFEMVQLWIPAAIRYRYP